MKQSGRLIRFSAPGWKVQLMLFIPAVPSYINGPFQPWRCLSWLDGAQISRAMGIPGLETVIWVLVISGSFLLFREYARRVCFAALWMKAVLLLDFAVAAVQTIALGLLAYGGELSASRALEVMGLVCGVAGLVWFWGNRRAFQFSRAQVSSDVSRNWSFGRWVLGDSLVFFMGCELYPWILSSYHGAAAVGVLTACQGVVTLSGPFLQGCLNFLPAKAARVLARGGLEELRSLVVKFTAVVAAIVSLFCVTIIVFGSQLVEIIYGPKYAGNGMLISILAVNILVYALSMGMQFGLWALGRADLNLRINLCRLGVTFTLGLWLVKVYGTLGVAWGLLLGSLVAIGGQYIVFIKLFYASK